MSWIALHQSLARHPKLIRLAARLGVERDLARAKLENLWLWALDYAPDGNLSGFGDVELAEAANWTGDPRLLREALVESGWLDTDPDRLHDWAIYGGRLEARRAMATERKRRQRERYRTETDSEPVTHVTRDSRVSHAADRIGSDRIVDTTPLPPAGGGVVSDPASVTSPEAKPKRKSKPKPEDAAPIPEALDSPAFRAAWGEWAADRRERRKPLTAAAARKQLRQLEAIGATRAIAAIEHSIASGYQGIFERESGSSRPSTSTPARTVAGVDETRRRIAEMAGVRS